MDKDKKQPKKNPLNNLISRPAEHGINGERKKDVSEFESDSIDDEEENTDQKGFDRTVA